MRPVRPPAIKKRVAQHTRVFSAFSASLLVKVCRTARMRGLIMIMPMLFKMPRYARDAFVTGDEDSIAGSRINAYQSDASNSSSEKVRADPLLFIRRRILS